MPDALHTLATRLAAIPTHDVLRELSIAARDGKVLKKKEFKKLVSYLLELADGRDRREPWVTRSGEARPTPRLRVAIEECFGVYGDLHWYRLNKTANASGRPLSGLFPRVGATLWRVSPEDFARVVVALLSDAPDPALLRLLQAREGKIKGMGVEVFSRLAYAFRRDLYFVIPREWGTSSGCLEFLGNDLRRYLGLCRNLRSVCDDLGYPGSVRGSIVAHQLALPKPPADLLEALHRALGPSLARFSALDPDAGLEGAPEDHIGVPSEFANQTIRARRGPEQLRRELRCAYDDRCAVSGTRLRDVLEVAYVLPYPTDDDHDLRRTILLRADLHTLWDLNLIGIEASTHRIHVAPRLVGTTYERLAGRTLLGRTDGSRLDAEALRERWRLFTSAHPRALRERPEPASTREAPGREVESVDADRPVTAVRPGETTRESPSVRH